jgi:hypothetical protein
MPDGNETPLLLQFLFGDSAGTAQRAESPRLLRGAKAFDGWLAERAEIYTPGPVYDAKSA